MNKSLDRLWQIAEKKERIIAGLMSGTSLDGLDVALCRVEGSGGGTLLEMKRFRTVPYPPGAVEELEKVVFRERVSLREFCLAHSWLGEYHGGLLLECLQQWGVRPEQVDCVASHGQTAYHAPRSLHGIEDRPHATLQMGDADHLARKCGILTVSDFRQKHTAAGGEGAPLAALADGLLFRDEAEDRLLLNIGGIANFTWLPAGEREGEPVFSTDTGPGNTLVNRYMERHFGRAMDRDGEIASGGTVDARLLGRLKSDPWFQPPLPRTTGPERFSLEWLEERMEEADFDGTHADAVATLTWFSAETIADAIRALPGEEIPEIYASGGGIHNPVMMGHLSRLLEGARIATTGKLGLDPDAREAACFALLANELLAGEGFLIRPGGGPERRVNLGKISFPV